MEGKNGDFLNLELRFVLDALKMDLNRCANAVIHNSVKPVPCNECKNDGARNGPVNECPMNERANG